MQRSNALIRAVFCLFLAAILAYFGFYIYRTFIHPLKTVQAVSATVADAASAEGYVVREEKVMTAQGVISPVADGKKIAAYGVVAVCYTDESALEQADRILALQERIAALQTALGETETASPSDVVADLSAAVAMRRFDELDTLTYGLSPAEAVEARAAFALLSGAADPDEYIRVEARLIRLCALVKRSAETGEVIDTREVNA